jgi:tripeptide aminopeptidase
MSETFLDRFLRYVAIDTQSDENSSTFPSTAKQGVLLELLVREMKALGLREVVMDGHGYVTATLPGNVPPHDPARGKVPVLGLLAHVDTSPSVSGADVKPQVIAKYAGGDIALPGDPSVVIRVAENPDLAGLVGTAIVTADGTTLLGADDKAGIAIILTAVDRMLRNSRLLHGDIRIGFTPDEEVGNGTKFFDLKAFGAKAAYTVDGGEAGELNKETFSADSAVVKVRGRNIHPGKAKGIMVNSIRAIADIVARLPRDMAPETTEGTQAYLHPHALHGDEQESMLKILLRDFRTEGLAEQKARLEAIIAEVQPLHPKAVIELAVTESYRNMKERLEEDPRVLECLADAVRRSGLEPKWVPIRGGTDGSRLTAMGLPTPNLFTGGCNAHGKTEWASVAGMEKSVQTLIHLCGIWVERSRRS